MPLLFDMPREQLPSYAGTNPKPADFDAFWDAGVAEVQQLEPEVLIEPADFQADFACCAHLWFTGTRGARIHAKLLQPRREGPPGPGLLAFHGYSVSSGDWTQFLPYVAAGFTVAALDCRGQGGLSQDPGGVSGWTLRGQIVRGLEDALAGRPQMFYYRQVFLDTVLLARIVMELPGVDPTRTAAMGASQGGGLTLACAALEPRVKLAAPVHPFLTDYQRVWEIDAISGAYNELQEWFRRRDPRHTQESEVFTSLGYIDVQHLAPRIRAEVAMSTGLQDTTCPPSTQFAAYNKIASSKEMILYPDYAHENLPGQADRTFQKLARLV